MKRHPTAYQYPFPPIPEGWTEDGKRFAYGLRNLFDILFARADVWHSRDTFPQDAKTEIRVLLKYGTKCADISIPVSELEADTGHTFYNTFYDGSTLYKCKATATRESVTVEVLEGSTDVTSGTDVRFMYK